jgi:hypothetical protein
MHREEIHAAEIPDLARFYYKMMQGNTSWKKTAEALAKEAGLDVNSFLVKGKEFKRFVSYFMK